MTLSPGARAKKLKQASRELTDSLGGIVASAEEIGKSKTVVGRNVNRNDEDFFFNLIDAARLEELAEKPFVTMAMARLAGGVFVALPETEVDATGLREKILTITEELGDVSAVTREALLDEKVKSCEADRIIKELDDLIERAVEMRESVAALGGITPVREVKAA
jgi:hypothetical protein